MVKVLLFGTGDYYQRYKKFFSECKIVALLDNNTHNHGSIVDGYEVISPADALDIDFDAVFLLSIRYEEMMTQLRELGIDGNRIFPYYDILAGLKGKINTSRTIVYGAGLLCNQKAKKRVLCITHNMNVTGAEIVLLEASKILRNNGYDVMIATLDDGPMREKFVAEGFTVIYDENLKISRLDNLYWIRNMAPYRILVNTVFLWTLLRCNSALSAPVLWWLHDSEMLYKSDFCKGLDTFNNEFVNVYAVSKVAKDPFVKRCHGYDVKLLPFGMSDVNVYEEILTTEKTVFAIIGTLEERKAQDVFLYAIESLDEDVRAKCEFWVIYQNLLRTDFLERIEKIAKRIKEVKLLGYLDREQMHEAYKKISVLVCPSLSDTLPVVTIEAMQYSIPCIVSDETGTASFIEDGINGLICQTNNVNDLANKIEWAIHNNNDLKRIGLESRKVYEKFFTLDVFEKNLLRSIE